MLFVVERKLTPEAVALEEGWKFDPTEELNKALTA